MLTHCPWNTSLVFFGSYTDAPAGLTAEPRCGFQRRNLGTDRILNRVVGSGAREWGQTRYSKMGTDTMFRQTRYHWLDQPGRIGALVAKEWGQTRCLGRLGAAGWINLGRSGRWLPRNGEWGQTRCLGDRTPDPPHLLQRRSGGRVWLRCPDMGTGTMSDIPIRNVQRPTFNSQLSMG